MDDRQKDAVYAWEGAFRASGARSLTPAETRGIIRQCCRFYGIQPPRIKLMPRNAREWSYYHSADEVIAMNWHQCNPHIACHEAAHAILDAWDDDGDAEDHGPEFLGIYLTLLVEHRVAPSSALEASAREMGLTWVRRAS